MIRNPELNILYLKTGLVTVLVAAAVAVQVSPQWASAFALAGLFGLMNWYLLGVALLGWTGGDGMKAMGAIFGKLIVLSVYGVIILPLTGLQIVPFLLGFNMFLVIVVLEAVGSLIADQQQTVRGARPLPRSLKALLTGRPNV